jgi:hypothetical protein
MGGNAELPFPVPRKNLNRIVPQKTQQIRVSSPKQPISLKTNQYGLHISSTQFATINSYNKKSPGQKPGFPINTHKPFIKNILAVTHLE